MEVDFVGVDLVGMIAVFCNCDMQFPFADSRLTLFGTYAMGTVT